MNVTDFKNKVLSLKLNNAETIRIKNLTGRAFKFKVRIFTDFKDVKEVNESNYKQVWFQLNKELAKEDKFHRMQTHLMRTSKGFIDYSNLAYNNSSDDL
jgi:flagellar basal body rod protein FlgC